MEPVKLAPGLERKLVAILAADVVGFSKHMERDEVDTLNILSKHREITDEHISRHAGRVTGSAGDSVIAEFSSVLSAVECAVGIQEALWAANQAYDDQRALWLRIGINVGDVMVKDSDIFGDGVNVAARLESIAEAGGVCVSRGVYDYVSKQTAYIFQDMGEQSVKNIEEPIRAFNIKIENGKAELNKSAFDASDEKQQDTATATDEVALELAFWESIKESGSVDELEAYLNQYPEGTFSELATIRISQLKE